MTGPVWAAVTAEPEPAGSATEPAEPEPAAAGPPRGNPTLDPGRWHPGR